MSEMDDDTMKSDTNVKTESSSTEEHSLPAPKLTLTDAHTFITQCREFIEKEKLAIQDDDASKSSENFLNNLTEEDLSLITESLFRAWKKLKAENVKVAPTIIAAKSWPPQDNRDLQDEDALGSFEEAKSVAAFSQAPDRPLTPDLLDLFNSEIRVVNVEPTSNNPSPMFLNEQIKSEAVKPNKSISKFFFKSQSWHNLTEEKKEEITRETTSLGTLERTASLDLSIRIYEWSHEDLRKRVKIEEQKILTPSGSKSEDALALSVPSSIRLQIRREFSCWLLNQAKKLFDTIVSEQAGDSDDTNQTNSSSNTNSNTKDSDDKPIFFPPDKRRYKDVNPFSDDTLSEITTLSTDSESSKAKAGGPKTKTDPHSQTSSEANYVAPGPNSSDTTDVLPGQTSTDTTDVLPGQTSTDSTSVVPGQTSTDSTSVFPGRISTDSTNVTPGPTSTHSADVTPGKTHRKRDGSPDDSVRSPKRQTL